MALLKFPALYYAKAWKTASIILLGMLDLACHKGVRMLFERVQAGL